MFEALANLLKSYYLDEAVCLKRSIARENWSIDKTFINLALLLSKDAKNEREKNQSKTILPDLKWHDQCIHQSERIYETRKAIALNDVFKPMFDDGLVEKSRLILYGGAGTGKSTVIQRIAYDWAANSNERPFSLPNAEQPFRLVIWIKLRELIDYIHHFPPPINQDTNIGKIFVGFMRSRYSAIKYQDTDIFQEPDIILRALYRHSHEILYLCDGHDEASNLPNNYAKQVYERFLLSQPNVLVTSRPHYTLPAHIDIDEFRRLELLGFKFNDSIVYIDQHFSSHPDMNGCEHLKSLVTDDYHIRELAHIPINLEILCTLMTSKEMEALPTLTNGSRTKIYQEMIFELLRRHVTGWETKTQRLLRDKTGIFRHFEQSGLLGVVGRLALKGLAERRLLFNADEVKTEIRQHFSSNTDEKKAFQQLFCTELFRGWVWTSEEDENNVDFTGFGEFIHLTFQEYMAAWWITVQIKQSTSANSPSSIYAFISEYKYHPIYYMTWSFVAGLLSEEPDSLSQFMRIIIKEPYIIAGANHDYLLLQCLEQIRESSFEESEQWYMQAESIISDLLDPQKQSQHFTQTQTYIYVLTQCGWLIKHYETLFMNGLNHMLIPERMHTISILGNMGTAVTSSMKAKLYQMLQSDQQDEQIIIAIAEALCKIEDTWIPAALEKLLSILKQSSEKRQITVLEVLGRLGSLSINPDVIGSLILLLQHENKNLRFYAGRALGYMNLVLDSYFECYVKTPLLGQLNDLNKVYAISAAHALSTLNSELIDSFVLLALVAKITDEEWDMRFHAAQALCHNGIKAVKNRTIIHILLQFLYNEKSYIRGTAAYILGELGKLALPEVQDEIKMALETTMSQGIEPWTETKDEIGEIESSKWAYANVIDALVCLGSLTVASVHHVNEVLHLFAVQQQRNVKTTYDGNKLIEEPDWSKIVYKISSFKPTNTKTVAINRVPFSAYWPLFEDIPLFHDFSELPDTPIINQNFLALITHFFCKREKQISYNDMVMYYQFLYQTFPLDISQQSQWVLPATLYSPEMLSLSLSEWVKNATKRNPLTWIEIFIQHCFDVLKPTCAMASNSTLHHHLPPFVLKIILSDNHFFQEPIFLSQYQVERVLIFCESLPINSTLTVQKLNLAKSLFAQRTSETSERSVEENTSNLTEMTNTSTIQNNTATLVDNRTHTPTFFPKSNIYTKDPVIPNKFIHPSMTHLYLMRKKDENHAFMLLVHNDSTQLTVQRIDLFQDRDKPSDAFIKISNAISLPFSMDTYNMQMAVENQLLQHESLSQCVHLQYELTPENRDRFFAAVTIDRDNPPGYFISGNIATAGSSLSKNGKKHHNCLTWAQEKISDLEFKIPKNWRDHIVASPNNALSDNDNHRRCCLIS